MRPTTILYLVLEGIFFALRSSNRRFHFERLYSQKIDPWNYDTSPYELEKYDCTLDRILHHRQGSQNALEVGCSFGKFTQLLAKHFESVTAIDVSKHAIANAIQRNRAKNIRFIQQDFRSLRESTRYDVIICAEILYYLKKRDALTVRLKLDKFLDPEGRIFLITGSSTPQPDFWEETLVKQFMLTEKTSFDDVRRPYYIATFAHKTRLLSSNRR